MLYQIWGMKSRKALVQVYIDALRGRAIYVHSAIGGQVSRIGFEPERKFEITATFWFAKPSHAELVASRCYDDFLCIAALRPHGWIDLPPSEVKEKIIITARLLGARWQTEKEIERDAEKVVDEIIQRVEMMRKNGGMAQINANYKAYRLAQIAKSEKAIPYPAYVGRYTHYLVASTAQKLTAG